jgi:hypothetical protein
MIFAVKIVNSCHLETFSLGVGVPLSSRYSAEALAAAAAATAAEASAPPPASDWVLDFTLFEAACLDSSLLSAAEIVLWCLLLGFLLAAAATAAAALLLLTVTVLCPLWLLADVRW